MNTTTVHLPIFAIELKNRFLILKELNADVIVVNGCRIISKKILNNVPAKFINTHEGITPKYRGIHGCYWALVNKDKEN